jgi:hypothetical protein
MLNCILRTVANCYMKKILSQLLVKQIAICIARAVHTFQACQSKTNITVDNAERIVKFQIKSRSDFLSKVGVQNVSVVR